MTHERIAAAAQSRSPLARRALLTVVAAPHSNSAPAGR
jgi:hypothetical protein